MDDEPDDSRLPIDPIAALSNIQDDQPARDEAIRWAAEGMIAGRQADELVIQLADEGWEIEEAEQIIEIARKETRRERGIVTRDDVVRDLNVDYRRTTAGLSVAFRSGLFGLYGFTTSVMSALRSLRKLKRIGRSREH